MIFQIWVGAVGCHWARVRREHKDNSHERETIMVEGRIVIIPFLQGKLNFDGTVTERDIEAILEKWLERHPEFRGRDFHVVRGKTTLVEEGVGLSDWRKAAQLP